MESFGGEQFLKNPKEAELEKQLQDLTEEHRLLDLEKGLDEWHIETLEQKQQAHSIDTLTGADTRPGFEEKLNHTFELFSLAHERGHHRAGEVTDVALIYIDLDNFKAVNDTLGHDQGDAILQRAASLMRGAIREEDTLGRRGGDEFVVLLVNVDDTGAAVVAEKIRKALAGDTELAKHSVTGSIGVASTSAAEATSPSDLMTKADETMYIAKHGGRNRVEVYHNS